MEKLSQGVVTPPPFRVAILLGYRLDDPLPNAVELAKAAALGFQRSGLEVEVRADLATAQSLQREARRGCDLLIFYGHGSEDGRLTFCDDRFAFADLAATPPLEAFWRSLTACFVFSCYGDRFARSLSCPWVAFRQPILTTAPKGFVYPFIAALRGRSVRAAVDEARESCRMEMSSAFADVMEISSAGWVERRIPAGSPHLTRLSAALAGSHRTAFASVQVGDAVYPDHEPFVGRVADLRRLLDLPSPASDDPLQRVVWVHGGPGMGKSALLRELASLVRDTVFREADERVHLLHLYCFNHTAADQVSAALCAGAAELYGLDPVPRSVDELVRRIQDRRGPHVWILDDLTYVAVRPEQGEQALALARALAASARAHALPLLLVVSSRRPPVSEHELLEVGALSAQEAVDLAATIWKRSGRYGDTPDTLPYGAAQLFAAVERSTAAFKRGLIFAASQRMPLAEYAARLRQEGARERGSQRDPTLRSLRFELEMLDAAEGRDGFRYRAFLGLAHRLLRRAAHFSQAELEEWFGEALVSPVPQVARSIAYQNGLGYLTQLGLLLPTRRDGRVVFSLSPNQRWAVHELEERAAELPPGVPLRGVSERLSLALELAGMGDIGAVGELVEMESDYLEDLPAPEAARAVFYSRLVRAELTKIRSEDRLALFDQIWDSFLSHRYALAGHAEVEEPVAMALLNKGATLGRLGRSAEALAVYEEVAQCFGDRPEASLAAQVATALTNKGEALGELNRFAEAITAYDEVTRRFAERPEAPFAERVARALVNKGVRLAELSRSDEAIAAYDEVVRRFVDRPEAPLAEYVASALFNKGVEYGNLGRLSDEIAVYDELTRRFADRPEDLIAQRVGNALVNKGVALGQRNRFAEEMAAYDEVAQRFAGRPAPPVAEVVANALFNKGVRLEALGHSDEAMDTYDQVAMRFADSHEAPLAEYVASALLNKGVLLGRRYRCAEEIAAYDEIARRFGDRPEASLTEKVARARLARAVAGQALGAVDSTAGELSALSEEFSQSPHASVREFAGSFAAALDRHAYLRQLRRSRPR